MAMQPKEQIREEGKKQGQICMHNTHLSNAQRREQGKTVKASVSATQARKEEGAS
jgi:hypothetical protein